MLFNSFNFAIFFCIFFFAYWATPHKFRWALLLVGSYYFYMSWNPKYVVLILFTTLVSYFAAILIEKQTSKKAKNLILTVSALVCLGILFFYKYFNFFSESITNILNLISIKADPIILAVALPVGISFYTFQTLSYVIDVYKGNAKAERHFGYYATFISFFPQLVAGPIERTSNLLPQITSKKKFDYDNASYGLKIMAWGYFKKLAVADVLSYYVKQIYSSPSMYSGFTLVLATMFFAIQIYCDFSGYSDIAIGSAKLLGINLMQNFRSPYFASSIKEFWGRWHISLSTWFRDYIYIPLGGNRVGKLRHYFNLLVTFLASGLWHGASWNFVIWGGIHGTAQIVESLITPPRKICKKNHFLTIIKVITVFCICCFGWVFFVSNSLSDAFYVISHMFNGISNPVNYIITGFNGLGMGRNNLLTISISVLILALFDFFSQKKDVISEISNKKAYIRWPIYIAFTLFIIFFSQKSSASEFVYFQF